MMVVICTPMCLTRHFLRDSLLPKSKIGLQKKTGGQYSQKELKGQDDDFAEKLVIWAEVIRKTFEQGGCDEVVSTRRLVHISRTFGIFSDKLKSISKCINRFDDDTKATFLDLYTKVDSGADAESLLTADETPETPEADEAINIIITTAFIRERATPLSVAHFNMEMFMSTESKIITYLSKEDGYNTLTANQMRSKFGVKNPSAMVDTLRKKGYAIYRNSKRVANGTKISFIV